MNKVSIRVVSIVVVVALIASCSGGSDEAAVGDTITPPSSAGDQPVVDESNPFVSAGIAVTPIDSPVAAPGLTLTDWQSANLLRSADAGQGLTGAELRAQIPLPDGVVPIDLMIGAWVIEGATDVARAAQTLMPSLDFDDTADVIIPSAVVTLFTQEALLADADGEVATPLPSSPVVVAPITVEQIVAASGEPQGFARVPSATAVAASERGAVERPAQASDLCSALLTFQETVLGLVFDALGGKESWLGKKAQVAIGLLPKATGAYAIPGKGTLDVLMALGFVATLVGSVSPWTVSVVPAEDPIAYGVEPGVGQRGTVRAIVDPGPSLKWPQALKDCAGLLGIELPDINPIGGIVNWDPTFGTHATLLSQDGVIMDIDGRYEATLLYDTSVESADQAARGQATSSALAFEARVDRPGNETFDKVVTKIIDRYAGDGIIGSGIKYLTAGIAETVKAMSDPSPAVALVTVTFHDPPAEPEATTPTGSTPFVEPPLPAGACIGVDLFSQQTATTPAGVRLRLEPGGTLIWDFGSSAPFSADDGFGNVSTITLRGSITGRYSGANNSYVTSESNVNLAGTVEVLGNTVAIPPEAFTEAAFDPNLGTNDEQLICTDGAITVVRTGQVFA